jgi:hypothetical protein
MCSISALRSSSKCNLSDSRGSNDIDLVVPVARNQGQVTVSPLVLPLSGIEAGPDHRRVGDGVRELP